MDKPGIGSVEKAHIVVTELNQGNVQYDIRPDTSDNLFSLVCDANGVARLVGPVAQGQRVPDNVQRYVDLINNVALSVKDNGDGSFALDASDLKSEINVAMMTDLKKSFSMAKDAISVGAGEPEFTAGSGEDKVKVHLELPMVNRFDM